MGVPLLDASHLHAGDDIRKAYLNDLIKSFQDYGFVRLKNHGVATKTVQDIFEWVRSRPSFTLARHVGCNELGSVEADFLFE
jgi:isopenicillin N synthase-like dioxygenase